MEKWSIARAEIIRHEYQNGEVLLTLKVLTGVHFGGTTQLSTGRQVKLSEYPLHTEVLVAIHPTKIKKCGIPGNAKLFVGALAFWLTPFIAAALLWLSVR